MKKVFNLEKKSRNNTKKWKVVVGGEKVGGKRESGKEEEKRE